MFEKQGILKNFLLKSRTLEIKNVFGSWSDQANMKVFSIKSFVKNVFGPWSDQANMKVFSIKSFVNPGKLICYQETRFFEYIAATQIYRER